MPVRISVKSDYARAAAALNDVMRRQLPFATAAALTDTASAARQEITAALPRIFDRPTPFTVNAIGTKPATKANLTAQVFVRDVQGRYLLLEETGGTRTPDMNSRKAGAAFTEPGKIALDAYGNIPGGTVSRLGELAKSIGSAIAAVQSASRAPGTFGRKGDAERAEKLALRRRRGLASKVARKKGAEVSVAYFKGAGPHGRGPGGFFQRLAGHRLARLTSFGSVAHYKPIFRFEERVRLVASRTFAVALVRRLREAQASAR